MDDRDHKDTLKAHAKEFWGEGVTDVWIDGCVKLMDWAHARGYRLAGARIKDWVHEEFDR